MGPPPTSGPIWLVLKRSLAAWGAAAVKATTSQSLSARAVPRARLPVSQTDSTRPGTIESTKARMAATTGPGARSASASAMRRTAAFRDFAGTERRGDFFRAFRVAAFFAAGRRLVGARRLLDLRRPAPRDFLRRAMRCSRARNVADRTTKRPASFAAIPPNLAGKWWAQQDSNLRPAD